MPPTHPHINFEFAILNFEFPTTLRRTWTLGPPVRGDHARQK